MVNADGGWNRPDEHVHERVVHHLASELLELRAGLADMRAARLCAGAARFSGRGITRRWKRVLGVHVEWGHGTADAACRGDGFGFGSERVQLNGVVVRWRRRRRERMGTAVREGGILGRGFVVKGHEALVS